jgi:hypothetical protein
VRKAGVLMRGASAAAGVDDRHRGKRTTSQPPRGARLSGRVVTAVPRSYTGGYDYGNPTATSTTGTDDSNLTMDNTNGIMVSIDKQFGNKRVKIVPAMGIFNLLNGSTTLSKRGTQNASNANTIGSLLAPRVLRFGARVTW